MKTTTKILLGTLALGLPAWQPAEASPFDDATGYYEFESDFTTTLGTVDGTVVNSPTAR